MRKHEGMSGRLQMEGRQLSMRMNRQTDRPLSEHHTSCRFLLARFSLGPDWLVDQYTSCLSYVHALKHTLQPHAFSLCLFSYSNAIYQLDKVLLSIISFPRALSWITQFFQQHSTNPSMYVDSRQKTKAHVEDEATWGHMPWQQEVTIDRDL